MTTGTTTTGSYPLAYAADTDVWHKAAGQSIGTDEMIRRGGLDWRVGEASIKAPEVLTGGLTTAPWRLELPNRKLLYRRDTGEPLGVVSRNYHPTQPEDLFSFAEGLLQDGRAEWATAGTVRRGGLISIWGLMTIPDGAMTICGEEYRNYLFLGTDYDGKTSWTANPVNIRRSCSNAFGGYARAGTGFKIRHNARKREELMEQASHALQITTASMATYKLWAEKRSLEYASEALVGEVEDIIAPPVKVTDEDARAKAVATRVNVIDSFRNEYLAEEIDRNGRTRYSLWNALTGYVDHGSRTRRTRGNSERQARLSSQMWGQGARVKDSAYELLTVA
jgi:phage/plasmid-like protein (TIGR03299 family)